MCYKCQNVIVHRAMYTAPRSLLTVLPALKSFTFFSALALMTVLQRARPAGANCGSLEVCMQGLLSVCIIFTRVENGRLQPKRMRIGVDGTLCMLHVDNLITQLLFSFNM